MSTLAGTATRARPAARRAAVLGLIALAVVVVAVGTAFHVLDGPPYRPDASSLTRAAVVLLWAVAGAYIRWRRPADRFGLYLFGIAVLFALASLNVSTNEVARSAGRIIFAVFVVCLAYVLLCFPHDHLATKRERRLITTFALTSALLWAVVVPLVDTLPVAGPLTECTGECPGNAFQLVDTPARVSDALKLTATTVSGSFVLLVAIALFDKARSPTRIRQRLIVPVLCAASGLAVNYALFTVLRELDVGQTGVFKALGGAVALAIPLTIVLGQVRGRMAAATTLARLISDVGKGPVTPAQVQTLLRTALGDRQLTLALRDPLTGEYLDVSGNEVTFPSDQRDVSITWVTREGARVAALIHDAAVEETTAVTNSLAAAALMLLENTQLAEELRASRARIVASAQQERLRLERNLHDGAQQRLLGIQIKLDAARERAGDDVLAHELEEVAGDAAATVDDLRELAHGLYPTVLRERGLRGGLKVIARQTTTPVRIVAHDVSRCLPTVEEAVYYCAREAIQNATKHAGKGARVTVTLERRGADLHFAIADDGVGFDPHEIRRDIGITSMHDRIGAVGGTLEIASQRGRGTTVVGVVPGGCLAD